MTRDAGRSARLATTLALLALVSLAFALGACTHAGVVVGDADHHEPGYENERGHGPPPHAPAHGYRRKHHDSHHGGDVELVFDSGLGVYVVIGFPSHYWLEGTYYRDLGGSFQVSASIDGPWTTTTRPLPPGLAGESKGKPAHAKGKPGKS